MFNTLNYVNNVVMSKFKFVNIVDTLFLSVVTFFITFAWIQFFIKNLILSLICSAFITGAILFIILWFKSKKTINNQHLSEQSHNLALFKIAIQTMSNLKLTTTLKKLLPRTYQPKSCKGDINFIKDGTLYLITCCFDEKLTETKLLEIIKLKNASNIIIICSNLNSDIEVISKAFKNKTIELISLDQLFKIFNQKNISINTSHIDLSKHKVTLKQIFKNSLSRNKSKGYFISGLVLLFTSLIIPYKIYYVVFSSILFVLSIICRFKPKSAHSTTIFD